MSKVLDTNEKHYKIMSYIGGCSIAVGIIVIACGLACGVLSIINGGRLLARRSDLMF